MIKPTLLFFGVLMLIIGACTPAQPSSAEPTATVPPMRLTGSATNTLTPVTSRTDTPSPTAEIPPSETQLPAVTPTFPPIPPVTVRPTKRPSRTKVPTGTITATAQPLSSETPSLTPTLACRKETASVVLSASTESVQVGDTIKVTVTLNNEGCVGLGIPLYRLYIQSDGAQPIFTPENPEPVVHSLRVAPGHSDSAEFGLIAAAGGQAVLTATVSYEVHLDYPYWGMAGTKEPLRITVAPPSYARSSLRSVSNPQSASGVELSPSLRGLPLCPKGRCAAFAIRADMVPERSEWDAIRAG